MTAAGCIDSDVLAFLRQSSDAHRPVDMAHHLDVPEGDVGSALGRLKRAGTVRRICVNDAGRRPKFWALAGTGFVVLSGFDQSGHDDKTSVPQGA